MSMVPKLSIIIPTYQEEHYIERTLKNLADLDISHEIVVVDGGSTDGTLPIIRKYTNLVFVWDRQKIGRRQNIGEARNSGAAMAHGEYFVFIDADMLIPKPTEFFRELLAYFESHPKTVAVTVPFAPMPEFEKFGDRAGIFPLNFWFLILNNIFGIGQASGEFQMIRPEAFNKLGGFRNDLVAAEDVDMFSRLAKIGRTRVYWGLEAQHTFRRIHTLGWVRVYCLWLLNGISYQLRNKAHATEWKVIR